MTDLNSYYYIFNIFNYISVVQTQNSKFTYNEAVANKTM